MVSASTIKTHQRRPPHIRLPTKDLGRFPGAWMMHQKGHEKRAGEAGGKARFSGLQLGE